MIDCLPTVFFLIYVPLVNKPLGTYHIQSLKIVSISCYSGGIYPTVKVKAPERNPGENLKNVGFPLNFTRCPKKSVAMLEIVPFI